MRGGDDETKIREGKRSYRKAKEVGNKKEEARWANVIGDILKNRGEYVEALKWFRIDYDLTIKHLPQQELLPTCQALGEVYLRLQHFNDALLYQKMHLQLAKDANDLIEQQRACTQLGRTYHEMFSTSDDDHHSFRNAKKYFKSAMRLAQTLVDNPPNNQSSFLKEYIDAHNNLGMLEMDMGNLEEAQKILNEGLQICDEQEVIEDDDGRSRLHHNLGWVYMELRVWDKAREHTEKDIIVCKRIGHCQGEAKGYINLGELHYRVQRYEEAIICYEKALALAKSMEDEDALADQIKQNTETVKQAIKVMDELKKEEQNLKKLKRDIVIAKGTPHERKCLLQQNASLDRLIEKSNTIFAWIKHREFAKRKKRIASELCDKEKLSDSYLAIGESYQKLRNFRKAIKWYQKSLDVYKSIGNLEGQALVKINIGEVLDCDGDWTGALNSFEEGYRIAVEANLPSVQLSALENMHYSHMIRFDNIEEARRLQLEIDSLKERESSGLETRRVARDCCSETDTEGDDHSSDSRVKENCSPQIRKCGPSRANSLAGFEELDDDMLLISVVKSNKNMHKMKKASVEKSNNSTKPIKASPKSFRKLISNDQTVVGRKRVRVVHSDDEVEGQNEVETRKGQLQKLPAEGVASSDEVRSEHNPASPACKYQDGPEIVTKCASSSCNPINFEESACSCKPTSLQIAVPNGKVFKSSSIDDVVITSNFATSSSRCDIDLSVFENPMHGHKPLPSKLNTPDDINDECITFKIDNDLIHVKAGLCMVGNKLSIESLKLDLACLYYLQFPVEKRSKGLLPIIQHMKCDGRALESLETLESLKNHSGKVLIEVFIDGWVQKRLMKLYIDCCKELAEAPNMKLLKRLYNSEVEDEVVVSDCELQDISIVPLLNALHTHKSVAVLDLSHNLLGNGTMEKLQQIFTSSGQKYGDLTLDLHSNRFGPSALFQICECPVLLARLEVLNVSGNRLTDSCGSYLSAILKNCKALFSLNIERCSVTSRTIQKVTDALDAESVLSHLCIGFNNPVSGNSIINLLAKLSTLKRFSELNLNGIKLSKAVVNSLCQLTETSSLSRLMLQATGIGTDGAIQVTESLFSGIQESLKLDLSYCGLTSIYVHRLNTYASVTCCILQLNLGGNAIMQEGSNALASLLMNSQCCLKVLILNKCQLGLAGVLQIIQALAENDSLEELNVANNTDINKRRMLQYDMPTKGSSECSQPNPLVAESSLKMSEPEKVDNHQQGLCALNTECNQLEVADSEDDTLMVEATASALDNSCMSSCQRISISSECQYIQELSTAVGLTKELKLLDLSNNGFSIHVAEQLYTAWSSGLRAGLAWRHIEDQTIHLSVLGNQCCHVKPCCRRD
ncbi:TPR_8 domain-containing protein/TPR_12 domain-containing protein [Cephalotus follicularis]|uniref:Protein TONSOKU n=1 Tax=Cephalotus follicularis TaxID=3775 RepID=A0A1Q3B415_CEPFO|nr:TPR_8 domain-containing protein/TPR_12 domain-containing protein [Cephalotus follicularis]